jgi:hypothetical protein
MYPSKRHCKSTNLMSGYFSADRCCRRRPSAAPFVLDLIILAMHIWFLVRVALLNRVGDARIQTSNWFETGRSGFRTNGNGASAEPHLIVRVVAFANFRIVWDLLGTTWLGFLVWSTWWHIALPTFDPRHWFSCWLWCIKLLKLLVVDCSQPNVEPNICRTKETRATLQMLASLLHYSSSLANTSLWVLSIVLVVFGKQQ